MLEDLQSTRGVLDRDEQSGALAEGGLVLANHSVVSEVFPLGTAPHAAC